jgi:hypothetical protein
MYVCMCVCVYVCMYVYVSGGPTLILLFHSYVQNLVVKVTTAFNIENIR